MLLLTACVPVDEDSKPFEEVASSYQGVENNPFKKEMDSRNNDDESEEQSSYQFWPTKPTHLLTEVYLKRVVDGDTIIVSDQENDEFRVRLIGIDTPEMNYNSEEKPEPYAEEATRYVEEILTDRPIFIEIEPDHDIDRYGRTLAYVWVDFPEENELRMLNAILLNEGLAAVMTIEPNTLYAHIFEEIEIRAKNKSK